MWKVNVRLVVGAEKKQTFQASLYLIQEGVALAIPCREAVLNRQRQDCYSSTNVAITKHGVMRQWKLCTRWKNVSEHLMCTIISVSPWTRRFSCPIWNKLARTWTMLETTSGVSDGLAALSM